MDDRRVGRTLLASVTGTVLAVALALHVSTDTDPCHGDLVFVRGDHGLYSLGTDEDGFTPLHVLMPGPDGLMIHGVLRRTRADRISLTELLTRHGHCV